MAFYPGAELEDDPTSWCGPNAATIVAVLRTVGFTRCEVVWVDSLARRASRAFKRLLDGKGFSLAALQRGRLVVHAYR